MPPSEVSSEILGRESAFIAKMMESNGGMSNHRRLGRCYVGNVYAYLRTIRIRRTAELRGGSRVLQNAGSVNLCVG
jgi:hypothetical protein